MKLNNKGFAITTIMYGILILFVLLTGTYLTVLSAKKNRIDNIMEDFEKKESFQREFNLLPNTSLSNYEAPYTGKYIFDGNENCFAYITKGTILTYEYIDTIVVGGCTPSDVTKIYYGSDSDA